MITKSNQFYRPVCDRCGAILEQGYSMGQVLAEMREAGWERIYGDNPKDYCPKCRTIKTGQKKYIRYTAKGYNR